jgi:hypothetical protein
VRRSLARIIRTIDVGGLNKEESMNGYTRLKNLFSTTWYLKIFGNVVLVSGLFGLIMEFAGRYLHSRPANFGITFAYCGITLTGVIAVLAAGRLKDLEQRLDRMEMRLNKS